MSLSGPIRSTIIGALLCLLAVVLPGCSALRLAYANGPQLAWWWLDGYVDFSSEQTPQVKAGIERWFQWHRATQLPAYVATLASLQAQAVEPLSAAQACAWNDRIRELLDPAIDRALVQGADLVPGLGEAQLRHLEQRYAKNVEEMKDEYLQNDPAERRAASVKRATERAEQLYGALGEAQKKVLADGVAASPFDPQAWMQERIRRQRDVVHTLRRLQADKADRDARVAALRALVDRGERSPDPAYRAYQRRLVDYNCAFVARLHNATTAAQKNKARDTIRGYEDDLRAIIQPPPAPGNGATPG